MATVLTGIKPTGDVHIGNYLGAIRPAVKMANEGVNESLLFIADYHSLTSMHKGDELRKAIYGVAATWLACGLDPNKTMLYKQSDIPEIFELAWILSCFTPKGFMNRAHAYKARVAENEQVGKKDLDFGVNMGLYYYPVLMAADILLFSSDKVPVGEDQVQHVEFARDMAQKFNNNYGEILKLPEAVVQKDSKVIPGLDGRKMSKSYGNTIPLFIPTKNQRKLIMKIKTDSSAPEDPKDPNDSIIFDLYKEFASVDQIENLRQRYENGIGWGDAKQALFEAIDSHLSTSRGIYDDLMANPEKIDLILQNGAVRARAKAQVLMQKIRQAVGVLPN